MTFKKTKPVFSLNVASPSYINEKLCCEQFLFKDSFDLQISLAGYVKPSWSRKDLTRANLCLCLWILILQRNVFSGGGIVLLVQAHTTLGKAEIIILVTSTTNRIPVAMVEATLGLAGTEMVDLYPTTNKAKGALFKWDVSIMIVVSSSACKTLN